MKFANTSDRALDFVFEGIHCKVDVGGTCEIPDRMAWAVTPRGLPLTPVLEESEPEEPEQEAPKRRARKI